MKKPAPPFSGEGHARTLGDRQGLRCRPRRRDSARGLENFMIQAGGDLTSRVSDRPWDSASAIRVAPRTKSSRRWISNGTFSTSGDYSASFSGRSPPSPHHRRPRGAARARMLRDAGDRSCGDRRRARQGRVHPGGGSRPALIERSPHVEGVIVSAKNRCWCRRPQGPVVRLAPPTDGE